MAKRIANHKTVTLTAFADTTNITDSTYPFALQGIASQRTAVSEVYIGGQHASSALALMMLGRDSQVGSGALTKDGNLTDEGLDADITALVSGSVPTVFNKAATNKPQRDTAKNLLNLSLNAFGGIVRWVAYPGEEIYISGATASKGEVSLSAFTGSTASTVIGAHMVFETVSWLIVSFLAFSQLV